MLNNIGFGGGRGSAARIDIYCCKDLLRFGSLKKKIPKTFCPGLSENLKILIIFLNKFMALVSSKIDNDTLPRIK